MHDPERSNNFTRAARPAPPTLKERNAVQRNVERLLDELAPEKALRRGEAPPMQIEQHRTPSGCVLQASNRALSVSWFADTSEELTLGELQVVLWHGTVTRRGAARPVKGAVVASELVLHPMESVAESSVWRSSDGREFDSESLAAYCVELLATLPE
ncbi:MAG TPA: hypothetical protein VFN38_02250 [Gemmatimonadaceae bacterium]|nr:hypothetical protein [Gemmatimonadaceae bacterium]